MIHIRLARKKDANILENLFNEFSSLQMKRVSSIQRAISDSNAEFLVAEVDNKITAFIHQIFFEDPFHGSLNSLITNLFVSKVYRKQGIATSLIAQAIENAKAKNVQEVHVTTRLDNSQAIRLYERVGFHKEGVLLEMNP